MKRFTYNFIISQSFAIHEMEKGNIVQIAALSYFFSFAILIDTLFVGYTNVLKIDLKCPEKYIKAYIFFIIQWIEFKFENLKYISIYLTNIGKNK